MDTIRKPSLYSAPPLRLARLRFELQVLAPLKLPIETRGNVLRGAFGTVFQRTVCSPDCLGAAACPRRESCAYAMLFEPQWRAQSADFPSSDAPRGFLFRPTPRPEPDFGPHQPLHFELRLFGQAVEVAPIFIQTFQSLAQQGLHGKPVHLSSVQTLDWSGSPCADLFAGGKLTRNQPLILCLSDLQFPRPPEGPLRIDFLTPTWLKHDRKDQRIPTFEALICRLRARLNCLLRLYEGGEWQVDYNTLGRLAAKGEILFCHGGWQRDARRSSRTGQTMPMAGFLGTIVYEKVHPALIRLLVIGQEIHVGRYTVWGNGAYHVVF